MKSLGQKIYFKIYTGNTTEKLTVVFSNAKLLRKSLECTIQNQNPLASFLKAITGKKLSEKSNLLARQ